MPFDEALADRVRHLLARRKSVEEKKMFGGLGFLLNGNLLVGGPEGLAPGPARPRPERRGAARRSLQRVPHHGTRRDEGVGRRRSGGCRR